MLGPAFSDIYWRDRFDASADTLEICEASCACSPPLVNSLMFSGWKPFANFRCWSHGQVLDTIGSS